MRGILSGISLMALTLAALADDAKQGWGLQFRQDTFSKALFPLAMMTEEGDGFDKAIIAFACSSEGQLIAFFQPERFMMLAQASKAQFRDKDSTKEFTFSIGDVPHLGKQLVVDVANSAEIAKIFETASGEDVPFRTDKSKQGVFTSIGAAETFKIVQEHCPSGK